MAPEKWRRGGKARGWDEPLTGVLTGPANLTSEAFLLWTRRYADASKKPWGLASGRALVQTCPLCHPDRSDLRFQFRLLSQTPIRIWNVIKALTYFTP